MPKYTENLDLYLTDMENDGNDFYDFDRDLNENFEKIDEAIGKIQNGFVKPDFSNLSDEAIDYIRAVTDGLYTPVDLSVKHADEINTDYDGDVWAWIKARIQAANYSGIHIGDYIPVTLTGGTIGGTYQIAANQQHKMVVVGIDTYCGWGDTVIPHHIDFISEKTLETNFTWNDGNTNNGTAAQQNPWLSSKIYAILNGVNNYSTAAQGNLAHGMNCSSGGVLQMLPQACQNVLIQKRNWMEKQYNASKQVNYPSGYDWVDMGKLWVPHEVEVCGYQPNSYNRSNDSTANIDNLTRNMTRQYPYFMYNSRAKVGANTNARSNYWLCCPSGHTATRVCSVSGSGYVTQYNATDTNISACFGFRIG